MASGTSSDGPNSTGYFHMLHEGMKTGKEPPPVPAKPDIIHHGNIPESQRLRPKSVCDEYTGDKEKNARSFEGKRTSGTSSVRPNSTGYFYMLHKGMKTGKEPPPVPAKPDIVRHGNTPESQRLRPKSVCDEYPMDKEKNARSFEGKRTSGTSSVRPNSTGYFHQLYEEMTVLSIDSFEDKSLAKSDKTSEEETKSPNDENRKAFSPLPVSTREYHRRRESDTVAPSAEIDDAFSPLPVSTREYYRRRESDTVAPSAEIDDVFSPPPIPTRDYHRRRESDTLATSVEKDDDSIDDESSSGGDGSVSINLEEYKQDRLYHDVYTELGRGEGEYSFFAVPFTHMQNMVQFADSIGMIEYEDRKDSRKNMSTAFRVGPSYIITSTTKLLPGSSQNRGKFTFKTRGKSIPLQESPVFLDRKMNVIIFQLLAKKSLPRALTLSKSEIWTSPEIYAIGYNYNGNLVNFCRLLDGSNVLVKYGFVFRPTVDVSTIGGPIFLASENNFHVYAIVQDEVDGPYKEKYQEVLKMSALYEKLKDYNPAVLANIFPKTSTSVTMTKK